MEYKKIKITSKDNPKRFYRILAVKGDPDLNMLGALIGSSLNAFFGHYYMFYNKQASYVPDDWIESDSDYGLNSSHLSDLQDSFTYVYDTGESWEFDCKVMKRTIQYESDVWENPLGFVVEGKGQGIFEDDHMTLFRYLNGEIDPNSNEEIPELHQSMPYNLDLDVYGDFDLPLNLDDYVYFENDMKMICQHLDPDYEYDSRENDLLDEVLKNAALSIFMDDFTNQVYRKLIEKYDVNDAFDMIVNCYFKTFKELDESTATEELFFSTIKKHLKKLK
ncbi:IS1096 element passenger TnpR family protein [Floccifex sp.]|uniref:IS1096 element passenger TnpR family protein n=1 Tax=Floccifex sp. TaxID=2815810 RepID=UPI003F0609EC